MITCQWVAFGYPHEGCAEFGPPDTFTCGARARFVVHEDAPWGNEEWFGCVEHALSCDEGGAYQQIVRTVTDHDHAAFVTGAVVAAFAEFDPELAFAWANGYVTKQSSLGQAYDDGYNDMMALRFGHLALAPEPSPEHWR